MEKELKSGLIAALENKPSANFSADDINTAAINAILEEVGLEDQPTGRELRAHQSEIFALIEEAVDEILPKKLTNALGDFVEIKQFDRNAEVVFNIEKIGGNRAKLTISKGARGGIYRAARLDRKYFSPEVSTYTASVYVTLEELILGTVSLSELFTNILEGFEEIIYKEIFNALSAGKGAAGDATKPEACTKADLGKTLDTVLPIVKQYGIPTIFGSYEALSAIYNPVANTAGHYNEADSMDIRKYGHVQVYKGVKLVELPNYLIDNSNKDWFYDPKFVFVMPSGAKPVKVALKGDLTLIKNTQATGSEKWEAHKIMGVGVAMANNYAVVEVSDIE